MYNFFHSPRPAPGAGSYHHWALTPGGQCWRLPSRLCSALFWSSWTSRSRPSLSTGRRTSWRWEGCSFVWQLECCQVPWTFFFLVLQKGCGYHLDLLVVALMLGVCSIMGLPWFVAATVLSISHVNSLKLESECAAPGEQPKFLGIREQRVTGFLIFTLMGCSVFMTSVLKVNVRGG